jgi:hypothetical protein
MMGIKELIARLEVTVSQLETLPKPYGLYYAVKRPGQDSGWDYSVIGIGVDELRTALDLLKASQPLDPNYNPKNPEKT